MVSGMLQVPPLLAVAYALLGSVLPSLAAWSLGDQGAGCYEMRRAQRELELDGSVAPECL